MLENLITHVHGIINDYRLVVDGIEVRQPRPRASNEQDRKITLGLTKQGQNRFTVAEFLGYTKHVTPNFGVERPNVHNEGENYKSYNSFFYSIVYYKLKYKFLR